MKHYIAACDCSINGFRLAQVADDSIRIQLLNVFWIAAGAYQQSEVGSLLGKNSCDVTTHKSGGTCNKGLHKRGLLRDDPLTKFLRLERNVALSRRLLFPVEADPLPPAIFCRQVTGKKNGCGKIPIR